MADNRDQFALAACLDPQNAETVLLVVEGDALDQTRQQLAVGWFGLNFHDPPSPVGGVPLASTERSGNPVDSAALNIAHRSTRGGPLIDCTQQNTAMAAGDSAQDHEL